MLYKHINSYTMLVFTIYTELNYVFKTAVLRMRISVLVLALSKQTQQVKEEIDNVEVEIDRRMDVLLWRHLVHDHVGVVNDEQREQNCSSSSQSTIHCFSMEKQLTHTHTLIVLDIQRCHYLNTVEYKIIINRNS